MQVPHLTQNTIRESENIFISKSSPAAYQIKGNGAKSTTQAHILTLHTHGVGSKGQNIFFLLKLVMLHQTKGNRTFKIIHVPIHHQVNMGPDKEILFAQKFNYFPTHLF